MLKILHKFCSWPLRHVYRPIFDRWYDYRNNIKTRDVIPVADKKMEAEGCNGYQGVLLFTMKHFLRHLPPLHDLGFIDIGCGHGRACFMAAKSGVFSNVVGIDFDKTLIAQAERNKASFRYAHSSAPITFEQSDALAYMLPADRSYCVFLNNPFGEDILLPFLRNNLRALRQKDSFVAYINHMHLEQVLALGFTVFFRNNILRYSLLRLTA